MCVWTLPLLTERNLSFFFLLASFDLFDVGKRPLFFRTRDGCVQFPSNQGYSMPRFPSFPFLACALSVDLPLTAFCFFCSNPIIESLRFLTRADLTMLFPRWSHPLVPLSEMILSTHICDPFSFFHFLSSSHERRCLLSQFHCSWVNAVISTGAHFPFI